MNREETRKALKELKKRRHTDMKKYNLTDKLSLDDNPVITIKNIDIEINADAKTVLEVAATMETEDTFTAIQEAYKKLFSESDRKKIDKLKLKAGDFTTFINTAVVLAMGGDPDTQGEE